MLTKPNIVRLVLFTVVFCGALYFPVHEVISYEFPRTKPATYRYRVAGASLNDFELQRPNVSGRWKWIDYIFPPPEKANKLRLELEPPADKKAPKLTYVYYPMSRKFAEEKLPEILHGKGELEIKCYSNGRWGIGDLLIDGVPVKEPKVTIK